MKKRLIIPTFLATLLLFSMAFASAWSGSGTGSEGDPFLITHIEHLEELREYEEDTTGYYFRLENDLDFENDDDYLDSANKSNFIAPTGSFVPLGNIPLENSVRFNLDGNGYTISNLYVAGVGAGTYSSFITALDSGYYIKDISFIDVYVFDSSYLSGYSAGIVGINRGTIDSAFVSGYVSGFMDAIGGLVGTNYGLINNSDSNCSVFGEAGGTHSGGLVGTNTATGIIINSKSHSVVYDGGGGGNRFGVLVGRNDGLINKSYSQGSASAEEDVGGLVGENTGRIENSYASAIASASFTNEGGLVGRNTGDVISSYYDSDISGLSDTGKGEPKTTAEMQTLSTFSVWDIILMNNWEKETWFIDEGNDYPRLFWEHELYGYEPPIEEPEEQAEYLSTPIYQTMESTGAGLGVFMTYLARSLPYLIISLLIVGIVLAIVSPISSLIRNSIQRNQK